MKKAKRGLVVEGFAGVGISAVPGETVEITPAIDGFLKTGVILPYKKRKRLKNNKLRAFLEG